jgi:16S rRNA (guanine527-N7)-methyltransferase
VAPDLTKDRHRALELTPVSRETAERLSTFVELLLRWQKSTNLIAASTVATIWTRHIADSLQLLDLAPDARIWVDLGSGAGLPGLPIACALAGTPGAVVHLVESNGKKAAFLREAIRVTGAPATLHPVRIVNFVETFTGTTDVVTARALAPLKRLLDESVTLLKPKTIGLFPKGQDVESELTEATTYWSVRPTLVPSRTDPRGRIVVVQAPVSRQV